MHWRAPGPGGAGWRPPAGVRVRTSEPLDPSKLAGVDLSAGVYVKRGNLHALAPEDVQHASDRAGIESILSDFARRGIRSAYVQQEVSGQLVKFYGVSGGNYFSAHPEEEEVPQASVRPPSVAPSTAAPPLRPEARGGAPGVCGGRFPTLGFYC